VATVTVIVWELDTRHGVAVVGQIKQGLPELGMLLPGLGELGLLVVPALILAFIGTVQNIAMAQALAIKRRERVNPNQELVGLGLSNVVASVAGGMPVGGGLSRTAINVAAGAQTPLASVVAAFAMLALVWAGTAGFARIPLPVLAASIVVAALNMVDVAEFRRAWAYDRADALAWLGTALGVLVLGLQGCIVLGIALSLATLLYRASTPHIAVVGRVAGTEHFRNVERHGVETLPGVLFLRIDESIFFGNLRAIEARLMAELAKLTEPRAVVLIMSAVNRVDLTGLEALTDLQRDLSARGVVLHLAEVKGVGESVVHDLKLMEAAARRISQGAIRGRQVLSSWEAVLDYCRTTMGFAEIEQLRVLFLDKKNGLIRDEMMQKGTVDHTPVYPREIMRRALQLNASAIILVHNHPSGDTTPSRADIEMTREIIEHAETLGLTVHDHLIIGRRGHASFRAMGLL
jgi:DNA repair protein RadC